MLCWVDREISSSIPCDDRGLAFGDGAFETLRVTNGQPVLWAEHCERLARACRCLNLHWSQEAQASVHTFIREQTAGRGDQVVKLILTRRHGMAYRPHPDGQSREIIFSRACEAPSDFLYQRGIALRVLDFTLWPQPQLAGLKHLNRLEQVLASAHLDKNEFEGLLCDVEGHVIEGTRSNFLYLHQGQWWTPQAQGCGVRGTLLAWLLNNGLVQERTITRDVLGTVEAAAVINSVFGVIPVASISACGLQVDPTLTLQDSVHRALQIPLPARKLPL